MLATYWTEQNSTTKTLTPWVAISTKEVCKEDNEFVLKIMKLDPRDRPTAQQLLEDEWFQQG